LEYFLSDANGKEEPMSHLRSIVGVLIVVIVLLSVCKADTSQDKGTTFVVEKFAPGGTAENLQSKHLKLMQKAFELADKFQVPVIVLTDAYFVDSYYNFDAFDIGNIEINYEATEEDENRVTIRCHVRTMERTGSETPALIGCGIALMTVVDTLRAVDRNLVINELRIVRD